MSFTFRQRQKINHTLNEAGLASLDNPGDLLSQIALGIRTHRQFRSLLLSCKPEKRVECYESLASRLHFEAKPLSDYISEAAQDAEAQKLPVWDDKTKKFISYEDYNPTAKPLERLAQEAIKQKEREDAAKGNLILVCRKCTLEQAFPAKAKIEAYKDARQKGWTFEQVKDKEHALCPKCSPKIAA